MFAERNFINVFRPSKFFSSKKPFRVRNFHKTTPKDSKTFNFLYRVHISASYRKCYRQFTSSEIGNKKELVLQEKLIPNSRNTDEAYFAQKALINDFISSKTSATDEDWDILLQNVSSLPGKLNELNINRKVMEQIARNGNLDLTKDYLRFMKKRGKKIDQSIVIEFLKACYNSEASLTEEDLKEIRVFTNYLIINFQVMDLELGTATIRGLTILNDWHKSMEIAKNLVKNGVKISPALYSILMICSLKNQHYESARKILHENLTKPFKLPEYLYIKWIEVFQNHPNRLEELLIFFKENYIIPKKSTCDYLIQVYSQLPPEQKLEGKFTTQNFNGQCECCQKTLEKNILLENEFNEVRDAFLNRVIVGNDMFKNYTPSELQAFYKMVQTHGPFDIVIDGLNVAYFQGTNVPDHQKALLLERVVDICFQYDKKIFIIGRKHMRKFTHLIMENIKEKCHMFLINDDSEDDPFMTYATLYSGPNCYYVTKDYLRSEKFRLGDYRLCNLFRQWHLSHQILPVTVLRGNLQNIVPFKLRVQRTTPQSWHIPCYENGYCTDDFFKRSDSVKWLCLKR